LEEKGSFKLHRTFSKRKEVGANCRFLEESAIGGKARKRTSKKMGSGLSQPQFSGERETHYGQVKSRRRPLKERPSTKKRVIQLKTMSGKKLL